MECFNDLLLKLQEVHGREVEGWQVKVQELSSKKGCDTKRMEELYSRNQQMKEQQRLLTENIKTLENRLRAGLCDRCTVTQEVATRRQQEFEASQIQSLQHISRLVGEMNNLKKENKRLRDEMRTFRSAQEGHSDQSSNSSSIIEVKPNSSPDISPSSGSEPLINVATRRASNQPPDGDVGRKPERDQRMEEAENRQLRGMSRSHFESYKPLPVPTFASSPWKIDHSAARAGERRVQSIEGLDQRSAIPPQVLHPKSSSSSTSGVNLSRHVLHTPVPCRPQPIKSGALGLPWPLCDAPDWLSVTAAGTSQLIQPPSKTSMPRFPNLIPTSQHASPRRPAFGSPWPKHSISPPPVKEPTVVFRFRDVEGHPEGHIKSQGKKDIQPVKTDSVSGEGLNEIYDGPLDLSDRGKSKTSQTPRADSPLNLQGGERAQMSPDNVLKVHQPAHAPVSSPMPANPSSSTSTPPVKQEEEPIVDHNHKQVVKDQEQIEEMNGKTDQSDEKKVPVLTISLRPVVVLETLKQESVSSNGKPSAAAAEPGCSSDEQQDDRTASRQENSRGSKRKLTSVETESERDSDTENVQYGRMRGEEPHQKRMIPH